MAQLVGHLTLDFGSGDEVGVVRLGPMSGFMLSVQSACPCPSALPPTLTHVLSLKQMNNNDKKNKKPVSQLEWP